MQPLCNRCATYATAKRLSLRPLLRDLRPLRSRLGAAKTSQALACATLLRHLTRSCLCRGTCLATSEALAEALALATSEPTWQPLANQDSCSPCFVLVLCLFWGWSISLYSVRPWLCLYAPHTKYAPSFVDNLSVVCARPFARWSGGYRG